MPTTISFASKNTTSANNRLCDGCTPLSPYPLPLRGDGKAIVAKLDALSTETKKLEAVYKQKLADLDELKKSVLKKAFNGEL